MQQKSDSRTRILEAAFRLFTTRGFHQTAMSELAAEAQISVGQIYRSFKNKDEIISAIVSENIQVFELALGDVLQRVRSRTITIEKGFEELASERLSEAETALSFEVLAEAYRNSRVRETMALSLLACRKTLRMLACETNDALTESELEAAEELLLACLFGLAHPLWQREHNIGAAPSDIARMMVGALRR